MYGVARGICSDGSGDVFLPNENVTEFAHGGTYPINVLKSASGYNANGGSSVDPTTGNLAATVIPGDVEVYQNAEGTPTVYTYSATLAYCGYDDAGNLFVDGATSVKHHRNPLFLLAELPNGGRALTKITLNLTVRYPGQVQWDGNYMTIMDRLGPKLYRIKVSGSTASVVGETTFGTVDGVFQSWIQGGTMILPFNVRGSSGGAYFGFWNYPAGGSPIKTFKTGGDGNLAATVSVDPTR